MTIDVATLKARIDILGIIGRDTHLRKVSNSQGGEWAGPCPSCGGRDRFRVQPERGRFWCRQCSPDEHWGSVIDYVMWRSNITFLEACEVLGGEQVPAGRSGAVREPAPAPAQVEPEPDADWQERCETLVKAAVARLWSPEGERSRTYLHKRGLSDETIHDRELGLIYPSTPARGITIPWRADGKLWNVKIRLAEPKRHPKGGPPQKYDSIPGGRPWLYGVDNLGDQPVALLVEGEFDCMLAHQCAGDLVAVATLGSATKSIGPRAKWELLPYRTIFEAFDRDPTGIKAGQKLAAMFPHVRSIRVPAGKDVSDFHRAGGSVRDWLHYELDRIPGSLDVATVSIRQQAITAWMRAEGIDEATATYELENHDGDDLARFLEQLRLEAA